VGIRLGDRDGGGALRLKRRDLLLGGVGVGLAAAGFEVDSAGAHGDQDTAILRYALELEQLQVAFYRQALHRAYVSGELHEYATVVHGHEVAHAQRLTTALGSAAPVTPRFHFAAALADRSAFLAAAVAVEDLGVAAYDGQIPNLSRGALVSVAEIVSVEARHAAWIRDLAGLRPAPDAADPPRSAAAVRAGLARVGVVVGTPS
jgi:hypothetical protein